MTFFSFSLSDNSFSFLSKQFETNQIYFSKNITLWKELNNKKKKIQLNFLKHEIRTKNNFIGKKLLICLPPKFGLGDAIEYSIAIKSLIKSQKFLKIGIAFCSDYYFVFSKIFDFSNVYPLAISSKEIDKYDTVFHLTLEIKAFKFQKYKRSNIALEICKHFNINFHNFRLPIKAYKKKLIKTLSIFPVSTSMIRSLPIAVIDTIKNNFDQKYKIEIFIDNTDYGNHLEKFYKNSTLIIKKPKDIKNLIKEISKIDFGIFIDSGPLHVAKLFDKPGILVETSVSNSILLRDTSKIKAVKNTYKSKYCNGPCGLVDIFSYNKIVGCYETNKLNFHSLKNLKNLKQLQRRNKKEDNSHFTSNPVGCIKKINIEKIIQSINLVLKEH